MERLLETWLWRHSLHPERGHCHSSSPHSQQEEGTGSKGHNRRDVLKFCIWYMHQTVLIFLQFSSHFFIIKCLLLTLSTFLCCFSENMFFYERQMGDSDFSNLTTGRVLSGHYMRSRKSMHGNGYRFYGRYMPFWTGNWRTVRLIWNHTDATKCPCLDSWKSRREFSCSRVGFYWRGFPCDESRFSKCPLWFVKRKGFTLTVKWCHYVLPLEILNQTPASSEMDIHLSSWFHLS